MSRKRLSVALGLLVLVSMIVAACAPVATPTTAPPPDEPVGPKAGGTLTIAQACGPSDWKPWSLGSSCNAGSMKFIMNALVQKEWSTQTFVPDLAESWEISPDGLTYTFHLAENVTWHDGTPFTANDVSFTYHTALLTDAGSNRAGRLADVIKGAVDFQEGTTETAEGLKVLDDFTFEIELTKIKVTFMDEIATPWGLYIAPAHVFEGLEPSEYAQTSQASEMPIGTGPFVLTENVAGSHTIYERNEDYFKGAPLLDNIVMRTIGDTSVQLIEMEKGAVQWITWLNASDKDNLADAKEVPGVTVQYQDTFAGFFMAVTFQDEALADKRFRQAAMYAMDRAALVEELWGDPQYAVAHAVTGWAAPPGYPLELEPYNYNPEKARALLEDMDWDFDRVVELKYHVTPPPAELPIIQQWWEDVGIKTKLVQYDPATGFEVFYTTGDYEIIWNGGWGLSYFPDGNNTGCDKIPPDGGNSTRYCNPEYDALINQAMQTVDEDERNALFASAAKIWNEEIVWFPLFTPQSLVLAGEKLQGWQEALCGPVGCNTLKAITDLEKWYFEE